MLEKKTLNIVSNNTSRLYKSGFAVVNVNAELGKKKPNGKYEKTYFTKGITKSIRYDDCPMFQDKNKQCVMLLCGFVGGQKNVLCLDFDKPNKGEEDPSKLLEEHHDELFDTYVERTPSDGYHFLFLLDENNERHRSITSQTKLKIKDKVYSIDIMCTNNKVCLAPSKISNGSTFVKYKAVNDITKIKPLSDDIIDKFELIKGNEKIKTLTKTKEKTKKKCSNNSLDINSLEIKLINICIKNNLFEYVDGKLNWYNLGFIIKNNLGDDGIDLFIELSRQHQSFNESDCVNMYESIDGSNVVNKLKYPTIIKMINESNAPNKRQIIKEFDQIKGTTDAQAINLLKGPFTDADVAEYFYNEYGENFKRFGDYIYNWNGNYWVKSTDTDAIYNCINKQLFLNLKNCADSKWNSTNEEDLKIYQKVLKKLLKLRNNSTKKGISEEIKLLIKLDEDIFDMNPDLIGFKNGVYDLKNLEFRESRRDDFISLVINYNYSVVSEDNMNDINAFVNSIMPIKEERDFLLKCLSSCLGGRTLENILILTGKGRNGKDTLITYLLKATLGEDLSYYNNVSVITNNPTSGVNEEKCKMDRKRAVIYNEPGKDVTLKNNTLKELSGGKQINARGLYSKNTKTILNATQIICCNDIPKLDSIDHAISMRLLVIPFRSLFLSKDKIDELPKDTEYVYEVNTKYKDEFFVNDSKLPFFHLLLEYYKIFQNDGYVIRNIPKSISDASKQYLCESDMFLSWFNDTYEKTDDLKNYIQIKDVFEDFRLSDLYQNMTKREKRMMNKSKLTKDISENPNLRVYYKDQKKINGKCIRSVILGYTRKNLFVESDDE